MKPLRPTKEAFLGEVVRCGCGQFFCAVVAERQYCWACWLKLQDEWPDEDPTDKEWSE